MKEKGYKFERKEEYIKEFEERKVNGEMMQS